MSKNVLLVIFIFGFWLYCKFANGDEGTTEKKGLTAEEKEKTDNFIKDFGQNSKSSVFYWLNQKEIKQQKRAENNEKVKSEIEKIPSSILGRLNTVGGK